MSVVVHEADIHDSVGADAVFDRTRECFPRLKKILEDSGYKGRKLIDAAKTKTGRGVHGCATPRRVPNETQRPPFAPDCREVVLVVGKLSEDCHGL